MAVDKKTITYNPLTGSYDLVQDVSSIAESADLADYIPLSQRKAANGVATLNGSGLIPIDQLPPISITDTYVVASEVAMLALSSAETGDVAVRTDLKKSFILKGTTFSTLADWEELLSPTDAVLSVNSQTGIISLNSDDVPEGSTNLYYSAAAASAKANTTLDNITSTSIPTDLLPDMSVSWQLGNSAKKWFSTFTNRVVAGEIREDDGGNGLMVMDVVNRQFFANNGTVALEFDNNFVTTRKPVVFLSTDLSSQVTVRGPVNGSPSCSYTLPNEGTSGQVLTTDGAGILSWTTASSAGDFKADGTIPMTGNLNMNGNSITSASALTLVGGPAIITINNGGLDLGGYSISNAFNINATNITLSGSVNAYSGSVSAGSLSSSSGIVAGGLVTSVTNPVNAQDAATKNYVDTRTRYINSRHYNSATSITGVLSTIVWSTQDYDTEGSMVAGTYTTSVTGKFNVNAELLLSGTFILNNTFVLEIQKNGIVVSRSTEYAGGAITQFKNWITDDVNCIAGDTIRVQASSTGTAVAIVSSNFDNFITVRLVG